jgi:exopolyphosphatase/guanosine-5'-triphosphate,3'-diphosphate pyrophosphatase
MERTRACVDAYVREAEALGARRILGAATSAVRDARNGAGFAAALPLEVRILSGDDEARLVLRGVGGAVSLPPGVLVVDVGGGSTELVVADGTEIVSATSLELGSVRLTERYLHTDPPARAELAACRRHVRAVLPPLAVSAAVAVAGTATTAATVELAIDRYDPALVHGHVVTATALDRIVARLSALPLQGRGRVRGLEPARAPVIVAGLVVLQEVLRTCRLDAMTISDRDLLHGLAHVAADAM